MNATDEHPSMSPHASPPEPRGGPPAPPALAPWGRLDTDPRRKSPALAAMLSLMPGLGQVYVGYYRQGFVHLLVFGGTIVLLANDLIPVLTPLLGFFVAFFFMYNVVDAWRRASFYNQALAGIAGVALPAELSLPAPGGSLGAGVALIVAGLVLLTHTLFDLPFDWLEEWWPMAPVLCGVWLVVRAVQERRRSR